MNVEARAKELSARVRAFGGVKKLEKKAISNPSFAYKSLGTRSAPWLPKPIEKKKTMPKQAQIQYEALKIKDGQTPIKGKDYFTPQDIEEIKSAVLKEITQVDEETIVERIKSSLKEEKISINDLADVDTFVMKTREGLMTRYKIEELMHGGGSSSTTAQTYNEVVAGSDTAWTLEAVPATNSLRLYANGQRLMETTDYALNGVNITTVASWTSGTLLADYTH